MNYDSEIDEYELSPRQCSAPRETPCEFLTGRAGTGKTFDQIARVAEDPSYGILTATTGIAAVNLGATTVHALLKYSDTSSLQDSWIRGSLAATLHSLAKRVRWLIIDECFEYDQPVWCEGGRQIKIGHIVNKQMQVRVWSFNLTTGQLELKPVVGWMAKKYSGKLLRIDAGRTESKRAARIIKCTDNHKIFTPDGYRPASSLRVGDKVAVRGIALTPFQRSMIVGSLLGDASLSHHAKRTSIQVRFMNGEAQLEYLLAKKRILGVLAGSMSVGRSGYKPENKIHYLNMNVVDDLSDISDNMISIGRYWEPADTYIEWIDDVALAFWFMDDGSINRAGNRAEIHTPPISLERHERLCAWLKYHHGLDCKPVPNGKGRHKIAFTASGTRKLMDMIRPYVPACMSYKVAGGNTDYSKQFIQENDTTCHARIRSISLVDRSTQSSCVFDLQVQDNHNYIAGNILVSNCSMLPDRQLDFIYQGVSAANQFADVESPMGIRLVGDLAQLPPVPEAVTRRVPWVFEAGCWGRFKENTTRLTKQWRQADGVFLDALNLVRTGAGDAAAWLLKTSGARFESQLDTEFPGTTILPRNDQVGKFNQMGLLRVRGESFTVTARRWGQQRSEWGQSLKTREWGIPPATELKIGSYVMILSNAPDFEYCNGDCGTVVAKSCNNEKDALIIRLARMGKEIVLEKIVRGVEHTEKPGQSAYAGSFDRIPPKEDDGSWHARPHYRSRVRRWVTGQVEYFPVRLAYATTVHKSQSLTLDRVQVDFRNHFFASPGMLYTALSRCRTLQGLRLVGQPEVFAKHCQFDPRVKEWL